MKNMIKPHLRIPFILREKEYVEFIDTGYASIWLLIEINESNVSSKFKNYSCIESLPVIDID